MKKKKIKFLDENKVLIYLANYFDSRQNIIVPNVSWGLGLNYEADMIIIKPNSGKMIEIEVKLTKSNLINDKRKKKWLWKERIRVKYFYYCIPKSLLEFALNFVFDFAGIVTFDEYGRMWTEKKPKILNKDYKLSSSEITHFAHLGTMRIWNYLRNYYELYDKIRGRST